MKFILKKLKSLFYIKEGNDSISKNSLNKKALALVGVVFLSIIVSVIMLSNSTNPNTSTNIAETDLSDSTLFSNVSSDNESSGKTDINYVDKKERVADLRRNLYRGEQSNRLKSYGKRDIPPGTILSAALMNKVISNSNNHPVIALVTDNYSQLGSVAIPKGTKLLGESKYEEESKRIQVSFHTMVFPDRRSISFSGMALDKDDSGSAGLGGAHKSKQGFKIAGSLLSNFVGGFAEGLQNRDTNEYGNAVSKGSVKNALLRGTSLTAIDQSRNYSSKLQDTKGTTTAQSGYAFLVYVEKEISLR